MSNSQFQLRVSFVNLVSKLALTAILFLVWGTLFVPVPATSYATAPPPSNSFVARNSSSAAPSNSFVASDRSTTTPSVGLSLSKTDLTLRPAVILPEGSTASDYLELTITTTRSSAYHLYLYADGDASLVHNDPSTGGRIPTVTASSLLEDLAVNTYGYYLGTDAPSDNSNYSGVPTTSDQPIFTTATSNEVSTSDTYALGFGLKASFGVPAGDYHTTLTLAVVADPVELATLSDLVYMQEMSADVCANSELEETKQLIDQRDGKSYWVAKLADNQCWMTQNLDFDLNGSTLPLQIATSDVTTPRGMYEHTTLSGSMYSNNSPAGTNSFDPGLYVKSNPASLSSSCGASNYGPLTSLDDSDCQDAGWTSVANLTPSSTALASGTAISGNTYDTHYLVGNYYQFNTAAADSSRDQTNLDVSDSVCPRGWRLPNQSAYSTLLSAYDYSNSTNDGAIAGAPLYLQLSGYIDYYWRFLPPGYVNGLINAGDRGRYWTSHAGSANRATSLYFGDLGLANNDDVQSTANADRYIGGSVRCVANH